MSEPDIATSPETKSNPGLEVVGSQTTREFIRYLVASAIALTADAGLLWLLTSVLNVDYLVSGAIAFLLGLTIVYTFSVLWVFEKRTLRSAKLEFTIFLTIGMIGLLFNELVLWLFTGYFGVYYLFSKLASVIVVFSWNFAARKFLLFR